MLYNEWYTIADEMLYNYNKEYVRESYFAKRWKVSTFQHIQDSLLSKVEAVRSLEYCIELEMLRVDDFIQACDCFISGQTPFYDTEIEFVSFDFD